MEEEEIVLSNWKRSENDVEGVKSGGQHLDEVLEKESASTRDGLAKESADLKALRLERDGRKTEFSKEFGINEGEDDIKLDDDTLSRLIEGDRRTEAHFGTNDLTSLNPSSPRPKPKPRHREGAQGHHNEEDTIINMLSSNQAKFKKNSTDNKKNPADRNGNDSGAKLFSANKNGLPSDQQGRKNSGDKLFSGTREKSPNRPERKNSADKLFSGTREKSPNRVDRKNSADKSFAGNREKSPNRAERKNSADKLFSGTREKSPNRIDRKNSADKLFAGNREKSPNRAERKNSADKLFSGAREKSPNRIDRKNSADKLFAGNREKSPNRAERKNSADKLFSGAREKSPNRVDRKNSADKLFAGNKDRSPERAEKKDSAANLFAAGKKDKSADRQESSKTSPRPVPRPRSARLGKEGKVGEIQEKHHQRKESSSDGENVDTLFDSVGKGDRTKTSRKDAKENGRSPSVGSEKNNGEVKQATGKRDTGQKLDKSPPIRPARTKVKEGEGSGHIGGKSPRQPKPRQPRDRDVKRHDTGGGSSLSRQGNYENTDIERRARIANEGGQDMEGPYYREGGPVSENKGLRGYDQGDGYRRDGDGDGFTERRGDRREMEDIGRREVNGNGPKERLGQEGYRRDGDGFAGRRGDRREMEDISRREMNGNGPKGRLGQDGYRRMGDGDRRQGRKDGGDMFEEHVPKLEGVLNHDDEGDHERRREGKVRHSTPMKAERRLEDMTRSPDIYNDFEYESRDVPYRPAERHHHAEGRYTGGRANDSGPGLGQRSSSWGGNLNESSRSVHFEEGEREGWCSPRSGEDLPSSRNIRESVYNEWLEKKRGSLKEKAKKKSEDKKIEEEKAKEIQEKQESGKKAFEVWNSRKGETLKENAKKKKELANKEIDEKREKIGKQKDAKKYFESWKSKKDEVLKESILEKRAKEKEAKQKEAEDTQEKTVIAKKSFEKWKQRKDEEIKEGIKQKRKEELNKTKQEIETERDKRHDSEKAYQEFLQKKGTAKRRPPSPSLTQRAWSPVGLTKGTNYIPGAIQPVVPTVQLDRSRPLSATTTMRNFNRPGSGRKGW